MKAPINIFENKKNHNWKIHEIFSTSTLEKISQALAVVAQDIEIKGAILVPAQNPKFGDYQCNVAMELVYL